MTILTHIKSLREKVASGCSERNMMEFIPFLSKALVKRPKSTLHTVSSISATNNTSSINPPLNVCMHVLGEARTDGRVMRSAKALIEGGFSVCIVDIESEPNRSKVENIDGIEMRHINLPNWFFSSGFRIWSLAFTVQIRMLVILRLLQVPADIYHAHDVMALLTCYLVARFRKKLLIFDAHELNLPDWNKDSPHWRWINAVLKRIYTKILPYCSGVITVSFPIAQEISERYHLRRVKVIRNVPMYKRVIHSNRLHQYLGLNSDVRIALYQGNLQADRGLDRLVQAAVFLEQNIVIVLMGKGVGITPYQLETLIAQENVADRVKIIPPVPYAELLDWTASADVGLNLLPPDYSFSIRMCLPNKLFEYLMAGLPVLTTPLEAVVEVIKTYDVGQVISSLAPEEIGASINVMLADRVALAQVSRNALDTAQNDLCWEKESQQLLNFYFEILNVNHAEEREGVKLINSNTAYHN